MLIFGFKKQLIESLLLRLLEEHHGRVTAGLVIADENDSQLSSLLSGLSPADFLVVNGDCKALFPFLSSLACPVITYGYSGKACVTASSTDPEVQICIQRDLPSMNGDTLEQREFTYHPLQNEPADCVLAAVTAALVCNCNFS